MTRLRTDETTPAWGRLDRLVQPSVPAFWLAVAALVLGLVIVQARLTEGINASVEASSLAIALWAIYAVPIVWLIARLDLLEPEPPPLLASAFLWGALAASAVALAANAAAMTLVTEALGAETTASWGKAIVGPLTEEPLKALGVVLILLIAPRQVTTVLDGLVYGMFVGLGFQVSESLLGTFANMQLAVFRGDATASVLDDFFRRGFALGLWSHVAYTGLVGAGIVAAARTSRGRGHAVLVVGAAAMTAMGLHLLWNSPWLVSATSVGTDARSLGTMLLKALPAIVVLVWLVLLAQGRETAWFGSVLAAETVVSGEDVRTVGTARLRRARRRAAANAAGIAGKQAARSLERATIALALALVRGGSADELDDARARVAAANDELARVAPTIAGGHPPAEGRP